MFRSSMRSSSGIFYLFLVDVADIKNYSNNLIILNISNIDKDVNKELPEDDLIEDRNILECFIKCFK